MLQQLLINLEKFTEIIIVELQLFHKALELFDS